MSGLHKETWFHTTSTINIRPCERDDYKYNVLITLDGQEVFQRDFLKDCFVVKYVFTSVVPELREMCL